MIIAVNTRLRKDEQPEGYENYLFEILSSLTQKFPEHRFLCLFDKPFDENLPFAKNVLPVITGPETSNSLRLQYWFNYKIPAVLRKYKADVFVSLEGICSLRTRKPQCLLISDLCFLHHPHLIKKQQARFFKKFMPAFLAKAKSIATVSAFSRSVLVDHYKISSDTIDLVMPGTADIFKPVDPEEKEIIIKQYAEGKAYFLFSGDINRRSNLINLLKAFSFFKKRQKSNMMLLIAGNAGEAFKKELKTYKYRTEVKLLENLPVKELARITAAAYAMVYPVLYADFALSPLQAMQCGVPVVTAGTGALPSICGDAALFADPENFTDIAENMMLVFKDEVKARALIKAGYARLQQYQGDKMADLLMHSILKAFHN